MTRPGPWTAADVPDLRGKRAVVTGASGAVAARVVTELARHGAEVVLAASDPASLHVPMRRIRDEVPDAVLRPLTLDVSDLTSVRRAADQVTGLVHLLLHLGGVGTGASGRTADGLEMHMAAHLFGPFALTGLLFPRLVASGDGRVVVLGAPGSRLPRRAPLEDPLEPTTRHSPRQAWSRSRLAGLMFVLELDQRVRGLKVPVRGVAAHLGCTGPEGPTTGPGGEARRPRSADTSSILRAATGVIRQPDELAALPALMAATADLPGSTCVGPGGFLQLKGEPQVVTVGSGARNPAARRRLWEIGQEVTGVRFLDG